LTSNQGLPPHPSLVAPVREGRVEQLAGENGWLLVIISTVYY